MTTPTRDREDPLVGTLVGDRFEVVRRLGEGGMGVVYEARHVTMDRRVALKLLHKHLLTHEKAADRFEREMRATTRIEHPNTVNVYDYGKAEDGRLYLALEFVEGRTLGQALGDGGPLPDERALAIAVQIARALDAAHHEGVVHRDLKPDNVMLVDRYGERDVVKVLDFGIAYVLEGEGRITTDGSVLGTPAYMAPEQARGAPIDARADLYALGVMLYEMVCGEIPFKAPTSVSLMVAHVSTPPEPPSAHGVRTRLEPLIMALLEKDPAARPPSARAVVEALEALQAGAAGPREPTGPRVAVDGPEPSARRGRRWGAVLALLAGAGGAAWWLAAREATPPAPAAPGAHVDAPDLGALRDLGAALGVGAPGGEDAVAAAGVDAAEGGAEADAAAGGADEDAVAAAAAAGGAEADAAADVGGDDAPPGPADAALAAARAALDAAYAARREPGPPEGCREAAAPVLAALAEAAGLLAGGAVDAARPEDARAVALLAAATGEAPGAAEAWALLARARLQAAAPPEEALAAAREASRLCPAWAQGPNQAGNAAQKARDLPAAAEAYQRAAEAAPAWAAPRFNLALLALRRGDAAAAGAGLAEVVRLDPRDGPAWHLLAQVRHAAGDAAGAREAWCRAADLGVAEARARCEAGAGP